MSGEFGRLNDTVDFSRDRGRRIVDNEKTHGSRAYCAKGGRSPDNLSYFRAHQVAVGSCRCAWVSAARRRGGGYKPQMQETARQDRDDDVDENRSATNGGAAGKRPPTETGETGAKRVHPFRRFEGHGLCDGRLGGGETGETGDSVPIAYACVCVRRRVLNGCSFTRFTRFTSFGTADIGRPTPQLVTEGETGGPVSPRFTSGASRNGWSS